MTKANPQTVAVAESGKASFVFDPGTAAKLQSLFVAINPIFPAEHPGPFTLPIFTGTISPSASEGTIQTLGSIELIQIGGGQIFLREAWLELGTVYVKVVAFRGLAVRLAEELSEGDQAAITGHLRSEPWPGSRRLYVHSVVARDVQLAGGEAVDARNRG